jgi:acyl-coenzyme A synthetase/AMP-(fatty) acid ligase
MTGFSGALPPTDFNMAEYVIGRSARTTPGKTALEVITDGRAATTQERWTYREIEDAVLRLAAALTDAGLEPGDRLVIRLENESLYALTFFAALAARLVALPTSNQLTEREAAFLVADCGARAVALTDDAPAPAGDVMTLRRTDLAAMLHHPRRAAYATTRADDPAYLVYTSGTTSRPKGVVHAHRAAWGRRPMYQGWYGISADDRMLHAGAFNWTYTLGTGLTDPWANGATSLVYTGEKDPALWPRLIRSHGATVFASVPTLYRQILKYAGDDARDLGRLRHGLVAGETAPNDLFETWQSVTGTPLYEAFGMSEMSTFLSSSPSVPRRPGTVGRAQPGRALAILSPEGDSTVPLPPGNEGLIAVHDTDPGLMLGYWNRPDEDREVRRGDWFVGGDLGIMDGDGYIAHRGRANDIMKALGYRVSPLEIEAALAEHPAIAEVACAEVQVRADVSVVGAYIVLKDGVARPAPDDIRTFAAERLAAYKCPREVVFVETLPRTPNGKVMRRALATLRT